MSDDSTKANMVKEEFLMRAGGVKIAAYRVRPPGNRLASTLQFHMTFGDTVMAVIPEALAASFCAFVADHETNSAKLGAGEAIWSDCPGVSGRPLGTSTLYRRSDGKLEYQIWKGEAVLALLPESAAKLFVQMVQPLCSVTA